MKGKIGFVLFLLGASGIAEFTKISDVLISLAMLIFACSLIMLEVRSVDAKEIKKRNSSNSNDNSRPYFLH